MITIIEQKSQKCVGVTSLAILFDYNKEIIDVIKSLNGTIWHKREKYWEAPCNTLKDLIDNLSYLDDVTLRLLEDTRDDELELTIDYKTTPFDYQKDGIKWLLNHKNCLLLDPPGLGKTLQIIYTAEELKKQEDIEHCLILCGINSLKSNWKKEIERHSNLDCVVIGEKINSKGKIVYTSIKERALQLAKPIEQFFVILNVESLRDNTVIDAIRNSKNKFDLIAFDEVHMCLDYMTEIETDQGMLRIGDIVEDKYKCKVKSYNEETGEVEWKNVVDWHRNVTWYNEIVLEIQDDKGKIHTIKCTPDHKIFTTNRGWVEAARLTTNDDIKIDCI